MFNYLYCDLLGLMDSGSLKQYLTGHVNGLDVTQGFLLGAAVLMEIPMAMIVLSRVLKPKTSRRANIAAGVFMTVVQIASLFVGGLTMFCTRSSVSSRLRALHSSSGTHGHGVSPMFTRPPVRRGSEPHRLPVRRLVRSVGAGGSRSELRTSALPPSA